MGDTDNKSPKKQGKHATLLWGADHDGKGKRSMHRDPLPKSHPPHRKPLTDSDALITKKISMKWRMLI